MKKIKTLWNGDIVEFSYKDEKYVALVIGGIKNYDVITWDFLKQEMHTFKCFKIKNVRLLEEDEYKKIKISDLPIEFQSPSLLCGAYEEMGYACYCADDTITAVKTKQVNNKLIGYRSTKHISFVTINGDLVRLKISDSSDNVALEINGEIVTNEARVNDLTAVLSKWEKYYEGDE
jgi:hypothetical protein